MEALQTPPGQGVEADAGVRFFLHRSPFLMGTVALLPDGDLLHLYDNPATSRFFRVDPGRTEGRTARELGVPEATLSMWRRYYEQAEALREHVSFEYDHELPTGPRTLSVTVSALGVTTPAGAPQFSYIAEDVTERRRAEGALADSEASLRALFDQAAVGLAVVGLDGRWLRVNRRLCDMLGYTEAEFTRLTFQDISHPGDLAVDMANVERLLAGEASSYAMEKRYYRRDGSQIWAQLTVSLMRGPDGAPDRFVSVVEDITARRAAEEALKLAERRLAMATRASGLGVWEWAAGTDAAHYSARAREICGFGPDEAITIDAIIARAHPDDRELLRARTSRPRWPAEEQTTIDYRILHPQAGVRWVRAFSTAVFDERHEGPVRLFGTLEDVTEQRRILDRLEASESRLKLALDAGRMAVFEWPLGDAEPPLTPQIRAQLGIPDGEPSKVEDRRTRYHPDDAAQVSSTRQRALQSQERFLDFAFRYFWPDGQMRWLQVRSEILRAESGEPLSLVGVQMDITEQRENEERMRLLMREVDHRANNLLTVVQSLVSLSKAQDVDGFRAVLSGRVHALARAHQLLAESRWAGADLRRLAEEELRPYGLGEDGRLRLQGPQVSLSPAQAQALGLALHELATNAAKYGALSQPTGQVGLEWGCADGVLSLCWLERGGPPATPPSRNGFGFTLLARSLGGSIGGEVEMEWAKEGLTARLSLPVGACS